MHNRPHLIPKASFQAAAAFADTVPEPFEVTNRQPTRAYLPPARKSTDLLKVMLQERMLNFDIDWFWSGRARCGRLNIRPSGVHAHGQPPLFSACYSRGTQLWGPSDERLDRLRTGSAKHQAVMAAIRHLQQHPSSRQVGN